MIAAALILLSVVLTLAVATGYGPLPAVDNTVANGLHGYALDHPGFVAAMQVWTDVCQPWTFRTILAIVAGWLWWRRRPRPAAWVVGTALLAGALDSGVKALIGRVRPHWTHPVSEAAGGSYPSGHSLTSAIACAVLLVLVWPAIGRRTRWVLTAVAVAVPLITGFTRLGLGVHYLSDVVGGWLIAAALTAAMALVPWHRPARPPS